LKVRKAVLLLAMLYGLGVVSWFVGWFLYRELMLWFLIKPPEYQLLLVFFIGAVLFAGNVAVFRAVPKSQSEITVSGSEEKENIDLKKLRDEFETLRPKVNDIHAFLDVLKKREELSKT